MLCYVNFAVLACVEKNLRDNRLSAQAFLGRRHAIDWDEHDYSAKQHGGPRGQSDLGRWRGNLTASVPLRC